jgi:hypothetical protein
VKGLIEGDLAINLTTITTAIATTPITSYFTP